MNKNAALAIMEEMELVDPTDRELRQRFVLRWLSSESTRRPPRSSSGEGAGDTNARIKTLLGALHK